MIYYINHFKSIGRTCTHAGVKLANFQDIYHQQDMEEAHKDPEVVPIFDPKYWPKTLETVEEYSRGSLVVDIQPLSNGLRDDLEPPTAASDPVYRANSSKYSTHDEEMVDHGPILSRSAVSGSDSEAIGPFSDSFITDRSLVWYKMVAQPQNIVV